MKHTLIASLGLAFCAASLLAQAPPPPPRLLELRLVASDSYSAGDVRFDLGEEKARLRTWLGRGDNADTVRGEPSRIDGFNSLTAGSGGPASAHLRWYPRVIRPSAASPGRWEHAYSSSDASPAVPLFSREEYSAGPLDTSGHLVELFPVNMHDPGFDDRDIDGASVRVSVDAASGSPSLHYKAAAKRRAAHADWSERHLGESCAVIVSSTVRSAPVFRSRIEGEGVISGDFSRAELDELARLLAAAAAPPSGEGASTVVVAETEGPVPTGSDPEDIRAMQGAQAMLAAEKKLRDLIKAGKISGVDRILTFEEISSWPYEEALLGMPQQIKKLDGKTVLMTGFMLPIDEVEDIKEFLLVESLWSCCYGQPPDINGIVRVVMKGDARIDYQFDPIKVTGQFKVEATLEDGYCVDIFQLSADSVEVIK